MRENELQEIRELVRTSFPDKTVVDISEYENEQHQTYKYLYDEQRAALQDMTEEVHDLRFRKEDCERENAELKQLLDAQRSVNDKLKGMTTNIMDFVEKFTEQEIIVSNVKAMNIDDEEIVMNSDVRTSLVNTISTAPGIYGCRRPSWFVPLKKELNKMNIAQKAAQKTSFRLKERLVLWKYLTQKLGFEKTTYEEINSKIADERKRQIRQILNDDCTNYEKYLQYFLVTPGMPKHFMNTLIGASELGLDANVIIELLEQPKETFNAEVIELYVSETHKGTEFNLKKEFAQELIRGDWYVVADINGKNQKFQMVPFELLEDLRSKLNNICNILSDMADEAVCADLAQTASDTHQNEDNFNVDFSNNELSSIINFDDSML